MNNVKVISAGAGAGKTWRLSKAIADVVAEGVPADQIMATTFTNKAADELLERVRQRLIAEGRHDSAARITDGYVGTMNSVFGRLVREFALELGLSPAQTILPEEDAKAVFQTVVADVLEQYGSLYQAVFTRMGLDDVWDGVVRNIVDQARKNNLASDAVRQAADYSWQKLSAILPPSLANGPALTERLKHAVENIRAAVPETDTTKTTQKALDDVDQILRTWRRQGAPTWGDWAKLSKLKPAKKSEDAFSELLAVASLHDRHPGLRDDIRTTIDAVFDCAADAMDRYQMEKAKRGVLDFTDQEALALKLLANPDFTDALRDRISHVFIDEFQDCSPLQLALVTRLLAIANGSTWVGDVKQAIFGFRDTDPKLMTAVMDTLSPSDIEVLSTSRRSRPSLVDFVNDAVVGAFGRMGLPAERVRLDAIRPEHTEQAVSIEAWYTPDAKNADHDVASIAIGVCNLLNRPEEYLVEDKQTKQLRPIRAGDVAVLCRSNQHCQDIADELAKRGVRSSLARAGLLTTPEALVAQAAYRYLVDDRDTLALAELIHLTSANAAPGSWLTTWFESDPDHPVDAFADNERVSALSAARKRVRHMSPTEAFDTAIRAAKVHELVAAWGGEQRMQNVEAVRGMARAYEDLCQRSGLAATQSGLVLHFREAAGNVDVDKVPDSDDDGAVRISTYHRAKGLEWPVVILTDLNNGSRGGSIPPVFNRVLAMPEHDDAFNPLRPLENRTLFYWPWPYGLQRTKVGLDTAVQGMPELADIEQRAEAENIRVLYVGLTRARDYLILATRDNQHTSWLQELTDRAGHRQVMLPGGADESGYGVIRAGDADYRCRVRLMDLAEPEQMDESGSTGTTEVGIPTAVYLAREPEHVADVFLPAHFQPSKAGAVADVSGSGGGLSSTAADTEVLSLGQRISLTGRIAMADLGDAVHAFLAADNIARARDARIGQAAAILQRYRVTAVSPESVVEAGDRLAAFIRNRYPSVTAVHREWPIHLRRGLQTASGWADLVLETPDGYVLIDHKTFPGPESQWIDKARSYLPQLSVYSEAIARATGRPVIGAWIHMPIVGAMVSFGAEDLVHRVSPA
ncbi:UvrD-helicase domain-containing protein [Alicyclobacillus sp. ALC3]|uniref:UvrD-helicase domain-containing protein n=1 Tax=Alicyclobacillus sp. ALC3 TaxID=2796143 RepID=UPI002379C648|nr:UvrD-helicase domain-containing protein [Alicyclobacillus sp. ALC3]WDL97760.1 UvrD-helicase domain-containing protein [Alicyclobacillus sp. ALC3]